MFTRQNKNLRQMGFLFFLSVNFYGLHLTKSNWKNNVSREECVKGMRKSRNKLFWGFHRESSSLYILQTKQINFQNAAKNMELLQMSLIWRKVSFWSRPYRFWWLHRCWWRMLETECVGDNLKMLVAVLLLLITSGDSSPSIILSH